ncbi:SPOR domain-containing protein [Pelagibius sp. 7325]|uniref:SPOR domain-containing protein n=1 Tax=Pelagibius sp. 7325 TaxID=3131994 RepID=UPI0030EF2DA7
MLALAACTGEVGPPPESDPPLVPGSAKAQPAPAQPTEPQAWSRDLDFDAGPTKIVRGQLAEGLAASDSGVVYSEQRLTYLSAFQEERRLTPAEQARQRAQERAAAAGLPPPPAVAPPPVEQVNAEPLPPIGAPQEGQGESPAPRRESRLPPPPKFPPLPPRQQEAAGAPAPTSKAVPEQGPEPIEAAAADSAPAGDAPGEAAQTAAFVTEAWEAPKGTILVQVSAVPDQRKVMAEWQRLQDRYPQILKPLRLVVEEARLGERGVFYRVQAGGFDSRAGAAQACDALISSGQACFVVVRTDKGAPPSSG